MGAKRVMPEEVKEMHRLYKVHGTYAEVARIMGRSSSTVSKYIGISGTHKALAQAAHHEFVKEM